MATAHVDPGELKYAVVLLKPVRAKNTNDHYTETWQRIPARAGVRAVKSADEIADGAARRVRTLQFIFRWREDVTSDWAVEYRGERYEIDSVDPTPWAGMYMRVWGVSYDAGLV